MSSSLIVENDRPTLLSSPSYLGCRRYFRQPIARSWQVIVPPNTFALFTKNTLNEPCQRVHIFVVTPAEVWKSSNLRRDSHDVRSFVRRIQSSVLKSSPSGVPMICTASQSSSMSKGRLAYTTHVNTFLYGAVRLIHGFFFNIKGLLIKLTVPGCDLIWACFVSSPRDTCRSPWGAPVGHAFASPPHFQLRSVLEASRQPRENCHSSGS